MAYQLGALEKPGPDNSYYDPGFLRVLEDHLEYLRTAAGTVVVNIEAVTLNRFQFDLRRLLEESAVPADLHWVVMRMNNLTNMTSTPKELKSVLVPDRSRISRLLQAYLSQNKIS